MEKKNTLNEDQLMKVSGGKGSETPPRRFDVGNRVRLKLYNEYGIGTILSMRVVEISGRPYWECEVLFDAGIATLDQDELTLAD